jgi:hypothetical protein
MTERRISAFFDNYDEAAKAVRRLEAADVPHHEISLIASNADENYSHHATRDLEREHSSHDFAEAGAAAGTIAGGGAGLLAGLGTVAVPGFGPIVAAGWLVSTLVGAGLGAATGGLVGALADAGFTDEEAQAYADGISRGGVLVTVKVDETEMDRIVDILDDEGDVDTGEREAEEHAESPAPPIGAAASTTTGLTTDLMPSPLDNSGDRLHADVEDERLRRLTGSDRGSA